MGVIFVNQAATGLQDGSSWQSAFTSLQSAIALAENGDEIWVAQGTYVPGQSRNDTFAIADDIEIYGGFSGSETQKSQRDWESNLTILSGEIGTANNITDNIHHVVTAQAEGGALLDGVIVEAGNTAGDTNNDDGGGIYNREKLTLENVIVRNNAADDDGGGIRNDGELTIINSTVDANKANSNGSISSGGGGLINTVGATTTVVNSTFSHNEGLNGGAIRNDGSLTLTNTTLSGNIAYESGGGLVNTTTNPFSAEALTGSATLSNSTITNNTAQNTGLSGINGGGIANFGSLNIANTIVAGNVGDDDINDVFFGSTVSDGHNLIGSSAQISTFEAAKGDLFGSSEAALDPKLDSLQDNGGFTNTHALTEDSIAIDNGGNGQLATDATDLDSDDNAGEAVPFDQRGSGFDRVVDGTVDIGAVEFSEPSDSGEGGEGGETPGNTPPTAIFLENTVQSLPENTAIDSPLRVADIVVSDDGLGSYTFSIAGRYDDLFEAIAPEIFETIATEHFDTLEDESLESLEGVFLAAIATEFFEAMGTEFFETVTGDFLDAVDAESVDAIDEDFLEALAEAFADSVNADFFETVVTEFLASIDEGDLKDINDDLTEQFDSDFFETLANDFLENVDADFFETLAGEFLAAVDVDTVDDIDAELLEETAREFLGVNDPDVFEIVGDGLFLKAGTELDFERKEQYNIVVQVDDSAVGETPDAVVDFSFSVVDVDDSPLKVTENQLLKVVSDEDESHVSVSVEQATQNEVYEIVVAATDEDGRINGIAPGEAGYLEALIAESWSVLSTLESGTFEDFDVTRSLSLTDDDYFQFAVIQDGTLDSLLENGIGTVHIGMPLSGDEEGGIGGVLKAESIAHGEVKLGFDLSEDGNFDDVVLAAIFGEGDASLGAGLQGGQESELLDLRDVEGPVSAEFTVYREADFDNVIGFFAIENEAGQVLGLDDETLISPGEAGYVRAAIARRLSVELTGENGQVSTYSAQVEGGQLLSTFIVSDGSIEALLDDDAGNDPAVYFTHLGANSDGSDHVRLLGDNIFGYEDMAGGGDQDFDDVVIKTVLSQ
ncbi:MAG: DUF4114 domain-containing protein [Cyanobacteria bacterium J06606_4]